MANNTDLIKKLQKISDLRNKALSIKNEMDYYFPEDNYERKVIVPTFPGEYANNEERNAMESSVDHTDEDAIKLMSDSYTASRAPKKPSKPKIGDFKFSVEEPDTKKLGCFSNIAISICIFFLLGAIFGVDKNTIDTLPVILGIAAIGAAAFVFFKLKIKNENGKYEKQKADALAEYNCKKDKAMKEHKKKLAAYEEVYNDFASERQEFLNSYADWRKIYLESVDEEAALNDILELERRTAVEKIKIEKLDPVLEELKEVNDILANEYLPAIDTIIDLLKSGRADDLKEAINLYEEILYRERQLELQKEQEEQRRREEEKRRNDEERRYQEEKRFREDQERQRRYEADRREREAERRYQEEKREAERRYQEEKRFREEQARQRR